MNYAGFWRRFLAIIIDDLVLSISLGIIGAIFGFIIGLTGVGYDRASQSPTDASMAFTYFFSIIAVWLYFALMESSGNQATLGKMAIGLRVTDLAGGRISFAKATGRFFGKYISGVILGIGFFMAGWTAKKQALHDMMAGTLVVKK